MKGCGITTESAIILGEEIVGVARELNLVFSVSLETHKLKIIGKIPTENDKAERLISHIVPDRDRLLFIPLNAKKIWVCNRLFKEWKSVDLPDEIEETEALKLGKAFVYKESLYIIGHMIAAVLKYKLDDFSIEKVWLPSKEYRLHKTADCFAMFRYCKKDNILYIASSIYNHVIELNIDNWDYKTHVVGDADDRFSGVLWDGNYYWLPSRKGTGLTRWDGKDKWSRIDSVRTNKDIVNFIGAEMIDDQAVFAGYIGGKTIRQDKYGERLVASDDQYTQFFRDENGVLMMCTKKGEMGYYGDMSHDCFMPIVDDAENNNITDIMWRDDCLMFEKNVFGLEAFMSCILR